jgi:hypothetical protein
MEIPRIREMNFRSNEQIKAAPNPPEIQPGIQDSLAPDSGIKTQILTDPETRNPEPARPNDSVLDELLAHAKQRTMQPPPAPVALSAPAAQPAPVYHSSGFQIATNEANQSAGESSWWKNILYFLPAVALVFMKK